MGLVIGMGLGLFGMMTDITFIQGVLAVKNLKQSGISSQAIVIKRSESQGKGRAQYVTYQYEVLMPDNTLQTFTTTQEVGRSFYQNVTLHESLAILYAQEHPKVSMIQGQTHDLVMRLDEATGVVVLTVFGIIGILLMVGSLKKIIVDSVLIHRLQRTGQVVTAKIIDIWPKDKRHVYIAYQFEVAIEPDFPKQKFGKQIILKAQQTAYSLGGTHSLRYLPNDSRMFILDQ